MKTLALDIGGVCVSIHPECCLNHLGVSPDELPPVWLQLAGELECGRITAEQFAARLCSESGGRWNAGQLREAFDRIIGDPLPGMNALVSSFPGRGIRPVFFSDTSAAHMEQVRKKFPAAISVPDGVYSYEAGARKPDPAMFQRFEARYGRPEFYFDDRQELIDAARRYGWRGAHRFEGAEKMLEIITSNSNP